MIKLNDNEKKVLRFLAEGNGRDYDFDEIFWSFKMICEYTQLDRRMVRLACRSLARKGLSQYLSGLLDEDGLAAGSGYGISSKGMEYHKDNFSSDKPTE